MKQNEDLNSNKEETKQLLDIRAGIMEVINLYPHSEVIGTFSAVDGPLSMNIEVALNDKVFNIHISQTEEVNENE